MNESLLNESMLNDSSSGSSETIAIAPAYSEISAPPILVDIGDPVQVFRGLIQRLIFRGGTMDRPWTKYPYVEKTIRFDFNRKLAKGDYISEATVTVTLDGADVTSQMFSTKSLPVDKPRYCDARLKGGTVCLEYKAQCKIVSAAGEKEEIVATIQVISDTKDEDYYAS